MEGGIGWNLRISILILIFTFLIDIIDKIISYSPYYVTRTSAKGSAVYWSRDTDGNNVTRDEILKA